MSHVDELARLRTSPDLMSLLSALLSRCRIVSGAQAGSLYLARPVDLLECQLAQNDLLPITHEPFSIPIDGGTILGHAVLTRSEVLVPDAHAIAPSAPFRFETRYDRAAGFHTRSFLVVPILDRSGAVLGALSLIKGWLEAAPPAPGAPVPGFDEEELEQVRALAQLAAPELEARKWEIRFRDQAKGTADAFALLLGLRDEEIGRHSERVAGLARALAETVNRTELGPLANLQLDREQLEELELAARLHDIGKAAVPEAILHVAKLERGEALDDEERAQLQVAAVHTYNVLARVPWPVELSHVPKIAASYGERLDGSGYPMRSEAPDLAVQERILAIVDLFDTWTAESPGTRPPLSSEAAGTRLREMAEDGKLDRSLVEAFLAARLHE